jgi:GTPase Era involved in 16S rRNA processing
MQDLLTTLQSLSQFLPAIILWLVAVGVATTLMWVLLDSRMPRPYNIAIIGYPESGKTTLIVSLFGEILASKIEGVRATLSTKSTTERVIPGIAALEMRKALSPAKSQFMFVYRADIVLGSRSWLRKTYKVEVGDFSEQTAEELAVGTAERLVNPEFEKWVNEADAFVFVIDVAQCYRGYEMGNRINDEYVRQMTAAIRTAWQNVLNYHTAGRKKLRSYPVILAFTKSDLINHVSDAPNAHVSEAMQKWGFAEIPAVADIQPQKFSQEAQRIRDAFDEVRSFFQQNSDSYEDVFVSSLGNMGGRRLGLERLVRAIFPPPPS